ncbi:MAG: sigma-54-dependent Fis family transcriptional regulator [Gammaproteobacteria bacterium]|nr:MAG: sigma-54-dependent Fis family transcriptional regulator [Gammaproteobacteria bacterium]
MPHRLDKTDWEEFLAMGRVPPQIRDCVLRSWQRSAQYPVLERKRAPILDEEELRTQRALSKRLRMGARRALSKAARLLDDTGNILMLCDRTGVVIDAVGDRETLERGQENHLNIGGNWSESAIGTNAIGTALHLRRSVVIREAEHFCEEMQRWNCAATPVRDPGSDLVLGVVDISWRNGDVHRKAAALSAALALQIEAELRCMQAREREQLLEQFHVTQLRRGTDPILVMDRAGSHVFATDDFARLCEDDDALQSLRRRIPELIDQAPDTIEEALADCMPGADLEVVGATDGAIGVMLSLRCRPAPKTDPDAELARIGRTGKAISRLCNQAQRLAAVNIPILIEGETGTGKTFLARAIHRAGPDADAPFGLVDCAELTEEQLRDDIASGRFERKGMLCLNSPGAMCMDLQKLLLGLVENAGEMGARIVALSTRNLYDEMIEGRFRGDLYYRIAGARLSIPPLRERRDEIEPLLHEMIRRHASEDGGRHLRFTSSAIARLRKHAWPGNLREMRNLVTVLDALSINGLVEEMTLPAEYLSSHAGRGEETLRDTERVQILAAIDAEGGNLTRTARRLGIARSTLYLKMDSYCISRSRG